MADKEEENYIDNLLSSLNNNGSDNTDEQSSLAGNAAQTADGDGTAADMHKEKPDFDEPVLSDDDMKRLENMHLDNIIEQVKSDTVSVEDLFGGESQQDVNQSDNGENEAKAAAQEVLSAINKQDIDDKTEEKAVKLDKKSKKKLKNKKSGKKGVFSVLKSVFFEDLDGQAPEEVAKVMENGESDGDAKTVKGHGAVSERSGDTDRRLETVDTDDSDDKPVDENEQLLREMYGDKEMLDENIAPKKGFIAKLKYRFAQFKKKNAEEERLEEEAEEQDTLERQKKREEKQAASLVKKENAQKEKASKAAQKQKEKAQKQSAKAQKQKKVKKPKPEPKPGDILKIRPKSVVLFVMFVAGVVVLICMLSSTIHYSNAVAQARINLENGNYDKVYEALSGMKLNKNDETLYRQACLVTSVTSKYESYENYMKMNMKTEAINALVEGLERYDTYYNEANELGVGTQMTEARSRIIDAFRDTFKISEAEAVSLVVMSNDNFTQYYKKIEAYGKAV